MIIVKAVPHRSSSHFETVCCAGIGSDHKWRRLYPVPFRILAEPQKFKRWDWLSYDYTSPSNDKRLESQKVIPESLDIVGNLNNAERSRLANFMTRRNFADAEARNETLTLIKPSEISMSWKRRSQDEIDEEKRKHADLVKQISMFDQTAKPLTPCPYEIRFRWVGEDGIVHNHICDDWESSAAFFKRRQFEGSDEAALKSLQSTYQEYFARGMRFAFGTHSRRQTQWLLVGILRVDDQSQGELLL